MHRWDSLPSSVGSNLITMEHPGQLSNTQLLLAVTAILVEIANRLGVSEQLGNPLSGSGGNTAVPAASVAAERSETESELFEAGGFLPGPETEIPPANSATESRPSAAEHSTPMVPDEYPPRDPSYDPFDRPAGEQTMEPKPRKRKDAPP